jgi:signal transduction histidine kinase
MTGLTPSLTNPSFLAYFLAFGLSAVACFASLPRASRIENQELRWGMVAILVTSGGWALTHVGFLLAPSVQIKLLFYYAGLLIGISTVGPWLYFCSAYSGRTLHRSVSIRVAAVVVFVAIAAVKLTNPAHGLYFRAEVLTEPFVHLAVEHLVLHWIAMGLAYALATVGYFMLLELILQVEHNTTPFVGLVSLTGLPVLFDVVGSASPLFLDITYEPIGVAMFAVGLLFVYLEDFQSIKLTGDTDDPVVVVDADDRVREYNSQAETLFPDIDAGMPFYTLLPIANEPIDADSQVVEIERADEESQYYQLSTNSFSTGEARARRAITFSDVTERERYRVELEHQNERLEQFASMVSHDLRNPLNVATARVELLRAQEENEHLEATERALDRMEALIDDLLTLARQGQPIEETQSVSLAAIAGDCWDVVDIKAATLDVEGDSNFQADATRLQQLLENLFRNAIEHGGEDVTITVGTLEDGFYVADDGPGIPEDQREQVFESGYSTNRDGTGFGLAIAAEIVAGHDWEIAVTESESGGARFEITGVGSD